MRYIETHITELELPRLDSQRFVRADLVDETGRPPRLLFFTYPHLLEGSDESVPMPWPRLVVHVNDAHDLDTFRKAYAQLELRTPAAPPRSRVSTASS